MILFPRHKTLIVERERNKLYYFIILNHIVNKNIYIYFLLIKINKKLIYFSRLLTVCLFFRSHGIKVVSLKDAQPRHKSLAQSAAEFRQNHLYGGHIRRESCKSRFVFLFLHI